MIDEPSNIATIIQNPDFPITSNEIVQVSGPSLFDIENSLPDYDIPQGLNLTPDRKNIRGVVKKYKSIGFSDRRNIENLDENLGGYGQLSVTNNDNSTSVHGQDSDGKNTQIIINLTHQPKSYLYGTNPENDMKEVKHIVNKEYIRPKPIGPSTPAPTQPLPTVTSPVGPPAPPVRPVQAGPIQPPGPPSISNSIFRNDVENRNEYNSYGDGYSSPQNNDDSLQSYQNYKTTNNGQSNPTQPLQGLAQPRSFYTPTPQNEAAFPPSTNYQSSSNRQPISSSTFSFSSPSSEQYDSGNQQLTESSVSTNSFYSSPPQSDPPVYRPQNDQSFNPPTNYAAPQQSAPPEYGVAQQAPAINNRYSQPRQPVQTPLPRPVAIPPSKTYFLPAPPKAPAQRAKPTYNSPNQSPSFSPSASYASPQADPILPPAPQPPPPTVINAYSAQNVAADPVPSYGVPQSPPISIANTPPKPSYNAPQQDPPAPQIQYQPATIALSIMAQPVQSQAIQTPAQKPSYEPIEASNDQIQSIQLSPVTVKNEYDGNHKKAVHYHVHLNDVKHLKALDQMFTQSVANDAGAVPANPSNSYGAPPLSNPPAPPSSYGAPPPPADPPAPPPRPQYEAQPAADPIGNYGAPQSDPVASDTIYGTPMQLTPPLRPVLAPMRPLRQRNPMYGRPRSPNSPRSPLSPLANGISGLASLKLNTKQNFVIGENSKIKELLGLKCFLWCKFDQLEFANRRSDQGLSSPPNQQFNSLQDTRRRPRSRVNNHRRG